MGRGASRAPHVRHAGPSHVARDDARRGFVGRHALGLRPALGNRVAKTYADGSAVICTYTPDNLPLRTTYASGRWIEYVYDAHAFSDGRQR